MDNPKAAELAELATVRRSPLIDTDTVIALAVDNHRPTGAVAGGRSGRRGEVPLLVRRVGVVFPDEESGSRGGRGAIDAERPARLSVDVPNVIGSTDRLSAEFLAPALVALQEDVVVRLVPHPRARVQVPQTEVAVTGCGVGGGWSIQYDEHTGQKCQQDTGDEAILAFQPNSPAS